MEGSPFSLVTDEAEEEAECLTLQIGPIPSQPTSTLDSSRHQISVVLSSRGGIPRRHPQATDSLDFPALHHHRHPNLIDIGAKSPPMHLTSRGHHVEGADTVVLRLREIRTINLLATAHTVMRGNMANTVYSSLIVTAVDVVAGAAAAIEAISRTVVEVVTMAEALAGMEGIDSALGTRGLYSRYTCEK